MRRLGCPILFGGGSSRSTTREGLAPRRRAIVRDLSPYSSQQSRWRGGAAFWACSRASTTALKPPTPRRGACARKSPNLAAELPLPLGAAALALGGASPQRLLRGDGGDAGGDAAQNRARRFGAKRVCPESAALGFPPSAGVAPLSNEVGTIPRTTHRNTGGSCASRGLRLFSRQLGLYEDAAGTICAGRENRSPVHWGRVGTLQARGWTTGAARSVVGARQKQRRVGRQFRNSTPFS